MAIGNFATAGNQGKFLKVHPRFSRMLPGNILRVAPGIYKPSFGVKTPRDGIEYFIDPLTGSGSNSGLTPGSPLQTPMQFFAKPNAAIGTIAAGSIFPRTLWSFSNQDLSRDTMLRVAGGGRATVLGTDTGMVWTMHPVYANVWTIVKPNVLDVADTSILDADGLWTFYTKRTTDALVSANPGSQRWAGSPSNVLSISTLDGRPPSLDDTIQVLLQTPSVFKPTTPGITITLQNIDHDGVGTVGIRATAFDTFPTLYADNCEFNYVRSTTNGFQNLGGDRFFFGCRSKGSFADGNNDHANGGRAGFAFEYQCTSKFNGDPSVAVNSNGTTGHDDYTCFQMEGLYEGNYGPNQAFVDANTFECAINCIAKDSRKAAQPNNITIGQGKSFHIGQQSIYTGVDPSFRDVVTAGGGTARYFPGPHGNPTLSLNGTPGTLVLCGSDDEVFAI